MKRFFEVGFLAALLLMIFSLALRAGVQWTALR
jgi:hypothetical protein